MRVLSLSATATATAAIKFQSQQQSPLTKGVFPATRGEFSISTRTHICFPQRRGILFFGVKSVESSSTVDDLQDFRVVPSDVLTENEETKAVKAVLTMFLKNRIGLSNPTAAATISKSVPFIDHLVARLHSIHKTRYPVGREPTALEISDALIPYLEYLCKEHGYSLVDVMENFLNPPDKECEDHRDSLDLAMALDSRKLKAMARLTEIGTDGQLPPNTLYLIDIGLDMNQIKQIARRYPSIGSKNWERKIKPLVEFLLDLGVPPSDIPTTLRRAPRIFGFNLSGNKIPALAYLETLGMNKSELVKVIKQFPNLLTCSKEKVIAIVDYLQELGLPSNRIGKCLIRCPEIIGLSIDYNLRPTAEYFRSMGVNLTFLLNNSPRVFCLSIERKLKPVTEFFLDKGYSIDEIATMASGYGCIYSLSLTKNLIPKWEFFLTMDYPRSDLVKCTNYFGFSLEGRIKPRYAQMKECGVKLSLGQFLRLSESNFQKILNKMKMKKILEAQRDSMAVTSDEDLESDV